jgi:hypothetical protein
MAIPPLLAALEQQIRAREAQLQAHLDAGYLRDDTTASLVARGPYFATAAQLHQEIMTLLQAYMQLTLLADAQRRQDGGDAPPRRNGLPPSP